MTRIYTVSQDVTSGLWYVHKVGYSYIPVFGSFCETKQQAKKRAAEQMGLTLRDYNSLKQ